MPLAAAIPAIIGAAGSIGGALLGGRKTTSQQTNTAVLDPQQQQIHSQLAQIIQQALAAGPQIPQWAQNAGRTSINETYNSMLPRVESQLASRGFDTSGKTGEAATQIEMGRGNAFSQLQQQLQGFADQNYQTMLSRAQQFQQPQSSTSTGTTTGPSQIGSAIGGIGGDISSLLLMSKLFPGMFGGGGSGGGGTDFSGLGDSGGAYGT